MYGMAQITITRALTHGTGRFGATLGLMIASHATGTHAPRDPTSAWLYGPTQLMSRGTCLVCSMATEHLRCIAL